MKKGLQSSPALFRSFTEQNKPFDICVTLGIHTTIREGKVNEAVAPETNQMCKETDRYFELNSSKRSINDHKKSNRNYIPRSSR